MACLIECLQRVIDRTSAIRECRFYSIVIDPLILSSEPVVEGSLRRV